MELQSLRDSSSTPNVLSSRVLRILSLGSENSSLLNTIAAGDMSGSAGKLSGVPVLFDDLHAEVNFIVLCSVPSNMATERPAIMRLGGVLDYPADARRLHYRGQRTNFRTMSEYAQPRSISGATDSEDFTCESEEGK